MLALLAVVVVGVVVGMQYLTPDKRMLALLAAGIIAGVAWRLDTITGLGLLIVAIPYQRGTVFGSTTFAFILLLLVLWLLRVTQRLNPPLQRTPLDAPIAGLLIAYAISFYNITDPVALGFAINNTELFISAVVLYYMLVSNLRDDASLAKLHTFQAVSIATIGLLAVYELNHPGGVFIPGWIEFRNTVGSELNTRNVRVGGPFFDFELLSEFCAVNALLIWFLIVRARSVYRRTALTALLVLDIFVLFATVTRGSVISLTLGILYLAFRMRRQLKVVPVALAASALAAGAIAMNFYVGHFTRSGSLGARLSETRFIGLIPDDRLGAWTDAWNRFLVHPIIGYGPYYAPRVNIHFTAWPHDIFLYVANLVGLFGLSFFVWILVRLFQITRGPDVNLHHPSYSRAFLPVAHAMFAVFLIDEIKIDYLRNGIYQFEVWIMFAMFVAASKLASRRPASEPVTLPIRAAA
jgi:O-antigen ligase